MVLYLSIVGTVFTYAQDFEYKSHTNANIASYPMPYRLFIPSGYNANTSYPLVLFLHGAGERGTDNNAQLNANRGATLWAETENQASYPCFVVAPQCPSTAQWVNTNWSSGSYSIDNVPMSTELKMVKEIIETLETQYNIDTSRLYVTGLSMGGYGTWDFIIRYPNMFKAAVPICGAGDPTKASLIGTMPLRVFHSSDDPTVPVAGSRSMVNAINALGPNNRTEFYTEYTDQGHFSWVNAYNTTDLVSWLFATTPITINCTNTPVTGVSVNTLSIELISNGTANLVATVSPANACNKAITWSSSNVDVATVSTLGFVTAKAAGTAIIKVTTADGDKIATCTVTVISGGPEGYTYSCSENATIVVSETMDIAYGANGSYLYKYNQTTNCGCNSSTFGGDPISGVLKACYTKIVGSVAVTGVIMSLETLSLIVNGTSQLTATVAPENATNTVTWSSSNEAVASVSSTGLVTAKAAGTATITVTAANNNKTATCAVTVVDNGITKFEAEDATLSGLSLVTDQQNYSGTGFVAAFGNVGNYVQFSITGVTVGSQDITLRYATADGATIHLYVNGTMIRQVTLASTGSWGGWTDKVDNVTFNAGNNTIKYQKDASDSGHLNVDYLALSNIETGIIEISNSAKESDISLSQNPLSTGSLLIQLPEDATRLSIFDVTGKMVYQEKVTRNELLIDQSVFKSEGVYVVNVMTSKNSINKKIIVTK